MWLHIKRKIPFFKVHHLKSNELKKNKKPLCIYKDTVCNKVLF